MVLAEWRNVELTSKAAKESLDQWGALDRNLRVFKMIDANDDGLLTPEEVLVYITAYPELKNVGNIVPMGGQSGVTAPEQKVVHGPTATLSQGAGYGGKMTGKMVQLNPDYMPLDKKTPNHGGNAWSLNYVAVKLRFKLESELTVKTSGWRRLTGTDDNIAYYLNFKTPDGQLIDLTHGLYPDAKADLEKLAAWSQKYQNDQILVFYEGQYWYPGGSAAFGEAWKSLNEMTKGYSDYKQKREREYSALYYQYHPKTVDPVEQQIRQLEALKAQQIALAKELVRNGIAISYPTLGEAMFGAEALDGITIFGDDLSTGDRLLLGGFSLFSAGTKIWKVAKIVQEIKSLENTAVSARTAVFLAVPGGSQTAPARFVRRILPGETIADLVNEGRALTWTEEAEHALVTLERTGPGRLERIMVSGGRDGIEFIRQGDNLYVEVGGQLRQVRRIIGHTHPRVTGPSDGDREVLRILEQVYSYIIEIGGESGGIVIHP